MHKPLISTDESLMCECKCYPIIKLKHLVKKKLCVKYNEFASFKYRTNICMYVSNSIFPPIFAAFTLQITAAID